MSRPDAPVPNPAVPARLADRSRLAEPALRRAARRVTASALATLLALSACEGDPAGPDPAAPAVVVIESGHHQQGWVGAQLPVELQVRVVGRTGLPVADATVEFRAGAGHGSVAVPSAATDARGVASAGVWTLGARVGEQRVEAVVPAAPSAGSAVFAATATDVPAEVRIVAGQGQRAQVGARLPAAPEVQVLNARGAPVAGVHVAFAAATGTVAGAEAVTGPQGRAAAAAWTLGTASGVQELAAAVAGPSVRGNPAVFRAVAEPGPPLRMRAVQGGDQRIEAGFPALVRPQVRVEDRHGNGVPGVDVVFRAVGGGSLAGAGAETTGPDGKAAAPAWIGASAAGAAQTLTATAESPPEFAGATVSFSAVTFAPFFDIRILHVQAARIAPAAEKFLARAEARWEAAVGANLAPVPITGKAMRACAPEADHAPVRLVDDLDIYVSAEEIDGPGSVLAFAGPCHVRSSDGLPLTGVMVFDVADVAELVAAEGFEATVLHEMGHVLGFGTVWEPKQLLRNPANVSSARIDTHFVGERAVASFDRAGGAEYAAGKVPVEHLGGVGARNAHWRESVFGPELLTGVFDAGVPNPLSEVTIASLEDIGYRGVDYGAADRYRLRLRSQPTAPRRPNAPGETGRRRFELVDDLRPGPIGVVDSQGRIVRYIQPTGAGSR